MSEQGGDSIDASLGDGVENANIGKGNTQNAASGNVVNVNFPPSVQPQPPPRRGRLMPEVEQELRSDIKQLTTGLYEFKVSANSMIAALTANTQVNAEQIKAIQSNSQVTAEQIRAMQIANQNSAEQLRQMQVATQTQSAVMTDAMEKMQKRFEAMGQIKLVEPSRDLPPWTGWAVIGLLVLIAIFLGIPVIGNIGG